MPDATLKEACLSAQRALPAWYGKLPGAGDFAERRMPRALAQSWERWFACGISLLPDGMGQASSDPYAHAPIWHFAVPAGAGAGSVQFGCIAPSFDRVGRRYPLLAAHLFDLEGFTLDAASWASERLAALGETLAQAIAPIIPTSADKLLALIDAGQDGAAIPQPTPLFPRLELPEDEEQAAWG